MGFGKDKKGVIFRQQDLVSLGTLATLTVKKQANPPSMTDSFRMIKSEGRGSLEFAVQVEGDGPLELYLASDDLTEAEIATALGDSSGFPLSRGDIGGSDVAMRPIFYLGQVPFEAGDGGKSIAIEWSKTVRWTFDDSAGFTLALLNRGSGALTTGGFFRFQHTAFGVWVGA